MSLVDEDRYPLVTDATFVPTMHAEIVQGPGGWVTPKLFAAVKFAWGILLRECAGRAVFTGESHLESSYSFCSYVLDNYIKIFKLCLLFDQRSLHTKDPGKTGNYCNWLKLYCEAKSYHDYVSNY